MIVFEAADHFSLLHSSFAGNLVAFPREKPPNGEWVPIIADGVVGFSTEVVVVAGTRRTMADYSLAGRGPQELLVLTEINPSGVVDL